MKTVFLLLIFVAGIMSGCEKKVEYERKVWVNEEAEVCGVKNPVENIDWLKMDFNGMVSSIDNNPDYAFDAYYCIYSDTDGNSFIVLYESIGFSSVAIYDCKQQDIMHGVWDNPFSDFHRSPSYAPQDNNVQYDSAPKCTGCQEFFETHSFVDTIATIKCFPISNN